MKNIGLRIEPGTPENVTELENIEQEDETDIQIRTVDQTDIQMHNLKNKSINLCGKMYSLKQRKEKKKTSLPGRKARAKDPQHPKILV